MIMPIDSSTTLEDAILDYAKAATAPFTAADAFPVIMGRLADPPSDPRTAIDYALSDCDWLLLDEEKGLFTPRHIFFAGTEFLIVPQPDEIEEGILIPGHRFLPFLARDIHPGDCRLTLADGTVVPTQPIRKPIIS